MSPQRIRLVILCEDSQQEAFIRRFFVRAGWHSRSMRVVKSPSGRGAGEQWVRERFPEELRALRRTQVSALLVAMVDADREPVEKRLADFDAACRQSGVGPRTASEPVAVFVPRRNVETWIAYLDGKSVNEGDVYPKLPRERDCASAVRALKAMCDARALREPAPASLQLACIEYDARVRSLSR